MEKRPVDTPEAITPAVNNGPCGLKIWAERPILERTTERDNPDRADTAILTHEISSLSEEIRHLLDQPLPRSPEAYVAEVERKLTEGYARALGLEAERVRLERRLGQVARELDGQYDPKRARELALIANRVTTADDELSGLRGLLVALRERFETANHAAARRSA
jgi:hypothetical protein